MHQQTLGGDTRPVPPRTPRGVALDVAWRAYVADRAIDALTDMMQRTLTEPYDTRPSDHD